MNSQEIFVRNKEKFGNLYLKIKKIHESIIARGASTHGHGFDHDLMVAQYGFLISENNRKGELAWIAGMMHSLDRHFSPQIEMDIINECLGVVELFEIEKDDIKIALDKHSKPNDPLDSALLIALKDADRLANIGAINLIRGGQHRPNIPACIPETLGALHPDSTFKNLKSCYDATFYNLGWEQMLRLPKAKEIAKKYFDFIREFQALVVEQFREVGLYPWPKEIK